MDAMKTIAVVDDDSEIRELLTRLLKDGGYAVAPASNGPALRSLLDEGGIDLVLLDLMLPGTDGYTLCREIREGNRSLPIIMLTARDEELDRVLGLELGADDYVTKPFSGRELLARIKAVLRRSEMGIEIRTEPETYRFKNWQFNPVQMELIDGSNVVTPLSSSEAALLQILIRHAGSPLSRDQLLDLTKGRAAYPYDRSVDTQVSRLRRKLRDDGKQPEIIKTVWGKGYMFAATAEPV